MELELLAGVDLVDGGHGLDLAVRQLGHVLAPDRRLEQIRPVEGEQLPGAVDREDGAAGEAVEPFAPFAVEPPGLVHGADQVRAGAHDLVVDRRRADDGAGPAPHGRPDAQQPDDVGGVGVEGQGAVVLVEQPAAVVGVAVCALVADVGEQVGALGPLGQGYAQIQADAPVHQLDLALGQPLHRHPPNQLEPPAVEQLAQQRLQHRPEGGQGEVPAVQAQEVEPCRFRRLQRL